MSISGCSTSEAEANSSPGAKQVKSRDKGKQLLRQSEGDRGVTTGLGRSAGINSASRWAGEGLWVWCGSGGRGGASTEAGG